MEIIIVNFTDGTKETDFLLKQIFFPPRFLSSHQNFLLGWTIFFFFFVSKCFDLGFSSSWLTGYLLHLSNNEHDTW